MTNTAILLLGSNVKKEENLPKALDLLADKVRVQNRSHIYESKGFETPNPNNTFYNMAVQINTEFDANQLKTEVLRKIEKEMGRVRTENRNSPRPIDIDILIFNDTVLDPDIPKHGYIAYPLRDIDPNYIDPKTKNPIDDIIDRVQTRPLKRL